MIEQTVKIVAIEGKEAWVESLSQTGCARCDAGQGCGGGVFSKLFGQKQFRMKIPNSLNADLEQNVVIGIPDKAVTMGSFLVYLMPVLGLIVGGLLGRYLDIEVFKGAYGELLTVILAAMGAFFFIFLARVKIKSHSFENQYTPRMIRAETTLNKYNFN